MSRDTSCCQVTSSVGIALSMFARAADLAAAARCGARTRQLCACRCLPLTLRCRGKGRALSRATSAGPPPPPTGSVCSTVTRRIRRGSDTSSVESLAPRAPALQVLVAQHASNQPVTALAS